jgi:C_GCAxxG_C_C family probable redox protein
MSKDVPMQSKQALFQNAYDLGYAYEKEYRGCAQCVIAALQDALKVRNRDTDMIFKSATGLAGGVAQETDGHCGAYSGGAMMIGYFLGRERENFADPEKIRLKTSALIAKLHQRFIDTYGTVTCRQIHTKIMGRPFYFKDPDELRKFDEAGAHTDKCTSVVGNAARWTAEILAEAGLI